MASNPIFDKENGFVKSEGVFCVCKGVGQKKIYTDELHKVLLEMMVELDRICRKNNIPYALAFGSALGLYNYHGFIPWDDDADIAIMYEDLPRLIDAFKKDMSPGYCFDCYETDKGYNVFLPTIKFRKENTFCREKNEYVIPNKSKVNKGIFIDIVVLMELPNDKKEHKKLMGPAKRRIFPMCFFKTILGLKFNKAQAKLKKYEQEVYLKYRGSGTIGQTILIPYQGGRKEIHELLYPKEVILPFKDYEFDGHKFSSFNNLEQFLKMFFSESALRTFDGEKWVDNYPLKKRKSDHYQIINLESNSKK